MEQGILLSFPRLAPRMAFPLSKEYFFVGCRQFVSGGIFLFCQFPHHVISIKKRKEKNNVKQQK